jgi:hypothetical protein
MRVYMYSVRSMAPNIKVMRQRGARVASWWADQPFL